MRNGLLCLGLIFPVLSLISGIGCLGYWRIKQRRSSPIFIPFVGPLQPTIWVVVEHLPLRTIPIVWAMDIGTLAFLAATPKLLRQWWQTSSFTRILVLSGVHSEESAILTLHSTGHYILKKSWRHPTEKGGIIALSEPGTFKEMGNRYELVSHTGLRRILERASDDEYRVAGEDPLEERGQVYSLNDWSLSARAPGRST